MTRRTLIWSLLILALLALLVVWARRSPSPVSPAPVSPLPTPTAAPVASPSPAPTAKPSPLITTPVPTPAPVVLAQPVVTPTVVPIRDGTTIDFSSGQSTVKDDPSLQEIAKQMEAATTGVRFGPAPSATPTPKP